MTDVQSSIMEAMMRQTLDHSIDARYVADERKKRVMGILADAASMYQYTSLPPSGDITIDEEDVVNMVEWYCADFVLKKSPTLLRKYKIDKMSQAPCLIHTLLKTTNNLRVRTEPFSAELAYIDDIYYLNNFQDVIEHETQQVIRKLCETQKTVTVQEIVKSLDISEICARVFACAQKVVSDFEQANTREEDESEE